MVLTLPCGGDDEQTQALLRTEGQQMGDERTGIVLEGGAVGIGEFFGGLRAEEAAYDWGFLIRFAPGAAEGAEGARAGG